MTAAIRPDPALQRAFLERRHARAYDDAERTLDDYRSTDGQKREAWFTAMGITQPPTSDDGRLREAEQQIRTAYPQST